MPLDITPVRGALNFYQETKDHLHQTGSQTYDLTSTHLLYLDEKQADAYLLGVMNEKKYKDHGFHDELVVLMRTYSRQLLTRKTPEPSRLSLADLGPGYPDKTIPLLKEAESLGIRSITYMPIDVSDKYLTIAEQAGCGVVPRAAVSPVNAKFEDLTPETFKGLSDLYIFLGLTYMNFSSDVIGAMLRKMAPKDSIVLVASELLTPTHTATQATERYNNEKMKLFAFGPIGNLGYGFTDFDSEVRYNSKEKRVEVVFTYKGESPLGVFALFKSGDQITTLISHRTTEAEFDADLARHFSRREIFVSPTGHTALAVCER